MYETGQQQQRRIYGTLPNLFMFMFGNKTLQRNCDRRPYILNYRKNICFTNVKMGSFLC